MAIENIPPLLNGTVVKQPLEGEFGFGDYVIHLSSIADAIPPWGAMPAERDRQLRRFWPTEPILASAFYNTVARYAAFSWHIKGEMERLAKRYDKMLHSAEFGEGWEPFVIKLLLDVFSQDNGGFMEFVRVADSPTSPVLNINHLDSARCVRTGRREEPVIYWDRQNLQHKLKWYQVASVCDMPSPDENMRGMQYCALTRMLRAAQIMRDIGIRKHEKLSGRFNGVIHLVSGVHTKTIRDHLTTQSAEADNAGLTRWMQPLIIGSLDPTARVSKETIELASLPEGYDEAQALNAYIIQMALAFGGDFQDFAPPPGGSLGGASQSQVSSMRARGKGPRLFMEIMEHTFNYRGVFPESLHFEYGDQDAAEDLDMTKLRSMRAEERAMRIKSGELSPDVARQIAVDMGDLDKKYLTELNGYTVPVAAPVKPDSAPGEEGQGRSGVKEPRASQDDGSASNAV